MASTPGTPRTIGDLVGRCLAGLGARRVFAAAPVTPVGDDVIAPTTDLGLDLHAVGDADLAVLLAGADGRLGTGPGVAILDGHRILLTSAPGVPAEVVRVADPAYLPGALAGWTLGTVHAAVEYHLDLDLAAPCPPGLGPVTLDHLSDELLALSPTLADFDTLVLVGPGVIRAGQVPALRALAASVGCGVLNTWGAKGVFAWDDPHHYGTVGLQARDFELAGVDEVQLIIAAGLDPLEAPPERWSGSAQVLEVEPWQLGTLAHHWPDPDPVPPRPPFYDLVAAALRDAYASEALPLTPARAAADLAAVLPAGGVVVADPGLAGLWVARAFPTAAPGSVVVPAAMVEGFAAAGVVVSALNGRPAIGVAARAVDPTTEAVLALARHWDLDAVVEVWGEEGSLPAAADHASQLAAALGQRGVDVVAVPVAVDDLAPLVAVAGEVVAWS